MTTINIHDLATLIIGPGNPWENDLLSSLGDLPDIREPSFPRAVAHQGSPAVQIDRVVRLGRDQRGRELTPEIFIHPSTVIDWRYRVKITNEYGSTLNLTAENACLEWLVWGIQLALVQANATFVHAAAVAKENRAIVFPSWGGIGKTALVSRFVRDLGWHLLGDDLVILTSAGECLAFPKPMVVYSYHRPIFPEVFAAGKGPIAPPHLNQFLSRVARLLKPLLRLTPSLLQFARRTNPQSVRIKPSEVFGFDSIGYRAALHDVVWLDRVSGIAAPEMMEVDSSLTSRLIGSTLFELDSWCQEVIHVACGLGVLSYDQIFPQWQNIVESALAHAKMRTLYVPSHTPIQDVSDLIIRELQKARVL